MDADGQDQETASVTDRVDDARLWACAAGLDAVQEAERVGAWRVGVEHLFAAALLDPVVRRLFLQAGGDPAEVQRRVGRPVRAGPRSEELAMPQAAAMALSGSTRWFLARLVERADTDAEVARHRERDGWRETHVRSTLRRWLLHDLLTSEHAAADRPVLQLSGAAASRLVEQLVEPVRQPSYERPSRPGDPAEPFGG